MVEATTPELAAGLGTGSRQEGSIDLIGLVIGTEYGQAISSGVRFHPIAYDDDLRRACKMPYNFIDSEHFKEALWPVYGSRTSVSIRHSRRRKRTSRQGINGLAAPFMEVGHDTLIVGLRVSR
jgi:hypothetical protein